MRKVFQIGGTFGLHFEQDKVDTTPFKDKPLGVYLPDGRIAELRVIEIMFYRPDFADMFDVAAHRAESVNLEFLDSERQSTVFEISGTYFWKFLEEVPKCFMGPGESKDYHHESLGVIMQVARAIYLDCFVDSSMENQSSPPEKCKIFIKENKCVVTEIAEWPEYEKTTIAESVDNRFGDTEIAAFVSEFIDDMLRRGYLKHSFESEGDHLRPVFIQTPWGEMLNQSFDSCLGKLSPYSSEGCPAYISWGKYFVDQVTKLVKVEFNNMFNANELDKMKLLPMAKKIIEEGGDLFAMQGSEGAVNKVFHRVKLLALEEFATVQSA